MNRYETDVNVQILVKTEGFKPTYWHITDNKIIIKTSYIGGIKLGKRVAASDP